jgi:DNA-binding cell septation regulator SpoVG
VSSSADNRSAAHSTEAERKRGNEYLAPDRPSVKIRRWSPHRNEAGTILGYLDVELPSGLVINQCRLMRGGPQGTLWIGMPSTKRPAGAGEKTRWDNIVEFATKAASERFQAAVLDALRQQHPEAV